MKLVYSPDRIRAATEALAREINRDYRESGVHLVGVLKGCFLFVADLMRLLEVPCTVDFVRLSSYGSDTESSRTVRSLLPMRDAVQGRHVLVVEEIVDSGHTLAHFLGELKSQGAASVKVCTLVDKTGRREVEVPVDYRGLVIEDGFLVGYGLDFAERYRNLPAIYLLEEDEIAPAVERKERAMATWTCPECGSQREARCKPKKCPACEKPVEFQKKDAPKK